MTPFFNPPTQFPFFKKILTIKLILEPVKNYVSIYMKCSYNMKSVKNKNIF